jgi:hypothetical protein
MACVKEVQKMDDAQARRWLALSLDGTDALSDDLIGEGAQLCADAMNARRQLAEAKRGEGTADALRWLRKCGAQWNYFNQQHRLTPRP